MPNHRGHAEADKRRALFSVSDRVALLAQAMGQPTGTIVEIGGLEFDLVPLSTFQAHELIELLEKYSVILDQFKVAGTSGIDESEILKAIHTEGGRIESLMRGILKDSVYFEDEEQEQLFAEWFNRLPLVPTLRALVPAVMKANVLKSAGNESPLPETAEPAAVTIETDPELPSS
jgi:hypothetical protein